MATSKQVWFIQKLMQEIGTADLLESGLYDTTEARTVRSGFGEELGKRQASEFIQLLLELVSEKKAMAMQERN